jgi:hypothetical protein
LTIHFEAEDGMNKMFRVLGVLAAVAVLPVGTAGLGVAKAADASNSGGPAYETAEPDESETGTQPQVSVSSQTDLPVLFVTGVEIMRSVTEPAIDIVRVTGLAGSQGWSNPQLVPTTVGKPSDGILDLQFIATMPSQSQTATGFVSIGAIFAMEQGHEFKGVRVRASENAIAVDSIPGHAEAAIAVDGCKDCVGKIFAERGKAAGRTSGVVRQEDLPKTVRWIPPNRGIRGITHNPNRLNLLLDANDRIIAAYWE